MKMKMRKVLGIALAAMMLVGLFAINASAANSNSITVDVNYKGQSYDLYKIFNATTNGARQEATDADSNTSVTTDGISYTLIDETNHALTKEFTVTKADGTQAVVKGADWFEFENSTSKNIKAKTGADVSTELFRLWAKEYGVKTGETLTAATDNATNIKWTNLADGYYFITTTTGSLITVDSVAPNAIVKDKNTVTVPHKDITAVGTGSLDEAGQKALAQLGTKVEYAVDFEVGAGAKNYTFHDVMGTGLTYNNDVKVYERTITPAEGEGDPTVTDTEVAATNYSTTTATGDTITVTFNNTYIASAVGKTLVVKYSATVNSAALTIETGKNTASISYGDSNTVIPTPETPNVYSAKLTVTKTFSDLTTGTDTLPVAGFVLAQTVPDTESAEEGATKTVYYHVAGGAVTWVDSIDSADVHESNTETGVVVPFTGLADGTYTLIEKNVPDGYNKAEDKTFTIAMADQNLTETSADVHYDIANNSGTELPSTGGIGTTMFYVVGGVLVAAAVVILVSKKRAGLD